ncbi:MAG TPA: hypothetical protein VFS62_08765 [Chloroflexota bacterium]|jgi:hypothetical protein|nr:hypothetical protein [Chloroflexota bacterium]
MTNRPLAACLASSCLGIAAVLAGLSLDSVIHARNPALAETEGIFTLTNPGHALLFAGGVLLLAGVLGTTWLELQRLRPLWWRPPGAKAGAAALLVGTFAATGWAFQYSNALAAQTHAAITSTLTKTDISGRAAVIADQSDVSVAALRAAAESLGVGQDQLAKELAAGQSMTQLAAAKPVPLDQVQAAIRAGVQPLLDQKVQDGVLTSAQAQQELQADPQSLLPNLTKAGARP